MSILDTGVRNVRNVLRYTVGEGALADLPKLVAARRSEGTGSIVFFIDEFFKSQPDIIAQLGITSGDETVFVTTADEPSTDAIDQIAAQLRDTGFAQPSAIVGIGGGITMDVAKAVSNLLTNGGKAEDYQGWDLVKVPGIYKVAIPTLSGTGAEATRTCVMTNKRTGLKLGMNSDFTVYDQIVMDPALTATVPRNQYFYTGMDAYIHCVEALAGSYRNAIGDAYSRETINLCRQVFLEGDMMSPINRERLMVASYLGGCAIATSYVGLVHPFSAGLSVVLGLHHCVANCIVMRAMQPYYPKEYDEFWRMVEQQNVDIPEGVARDLSDDQYEQLFASTVIHQKPLTNALGEKYRDTLTKEKVIEIFRAM
jgi:3-deoxy-alpha-D-manno-octulosonate 8-oxidase